LGCKSVKTRNVYGFISDPLGFNHLSTKYGKLKKKYETITKQHTQNSRHENGYVLGMEMGMKRVFLGTNLTHQPENL